jgi:hypothetical protein
MADADWWVNHVAAAGKQATIQDGKLFAKIKSDA